MEYSRAVIRSEWQALGKREKDATTENYFITLMTAVIRTAPGNPEEATIQQRLIDIAREAGEHRTVFVYPFHNPFAGAACFVLVATVLILANIVMTDFDNPFNGVYNVSSEPFSRLTQ
ncbi:MAG TPA: hypothetical protein VKG79_12925 [Bryobacteraceae bacterium]|nr:hypothetical protein [Bryobacteraceae bacterium]